MDKIRLSGDTHHESVTVREERAKIKTGPRESSREEVAFILRSE